MKEILKRLGTKINKEKFTYINAVRNNPLDGIFNAIERTVFSPWNTLNVVSSDYLVIL